MAQGAGAEGVKTIIEKLLFTVKFEMASDGVKRVEITEDTVLGKAPPIFHYEEEKVTTAPAPNMTSARYFAAAESSRSSCAAAAGKYCRSRLSDFDEAILEGMEL